ncbi:MAG: hypothetical protein IJW99_04435 [Clostridia bacterium]|nr:hypothetical protein [Clostridia bacterium]
MGRGVYLALAVEVSGGAVMSRLTDADLSWFERANFVRVRHLRDPAASAAMTRAARNGVI